MVDPSISYAASRLAEPSLARGAAVGRFELRRLLAQGLGAQLWLAFDPRLGREVTIKLMRTGDGVSPDTVTQWLQRARSTSHLVHPNIVPVIEIDVQNGWILQVCEHFPGKFLAALLLESRTLAPHRAVALCCDLLDALIIAHGAGIVHGSLTPADILVDNRHRGRIMHVGFADYLSRVGCAAAQAQPGLVAPETLRGLPATAQTDVYHVGLILAEMLWGRMQMGARLGLGGDRAFAASANSAVQRDDGGDSLLAIVRSMVASEPGIRPGTGRLREQLLAWSAKTVAPATASDDPLGSGAIASDQALQVLMQRMAENSDFPAMSNAVTRILGMASSETESVGSVTSVILKDVGLANKLLRMVNTAYYARGGSISTVSRAVSLVGFNAIRNMALGLVLLEQMQDKAHAEKLTQEFLRSLMAGSIARELVASASDAEEAFIGALFQNLGRLLAGFYFPQEAEAVRELVQTGNAEVSEEQASIRVLGQSFESLALAVAHVWELPQDICRHMRKPVGEPPSRAPDTQERLRWMTLAANLVADTLLRWDPGLHDARLEPVYKRFHKVIGSTPEQMHEATTLARERLIELVDVLKLRIVPGSPAHRLVYIAPPVDEPVPGDKQAMAPDVAVQEAAGAQDTAAAPHARMAAGIAEITQLMVGDYQVSDVVRMVLETIHRAKRFDRVIFCTRDARLDALTGRLGLGVGVEAMVRAFEVPLGSGASDLFHMVCTKGADTLIPDATVSRVVQRLPPWYRKLVNAPNFLLLPLLINEKAIGLIYADMARKDALALSDTEMAMLRTLRDQAVKAFKQLH